MRAHRRRAGRARRSSSHLVLTLTIVLGCLLHQGSRGAAQSAEPDSVFEASGFQKNRAYFSQLPFENIDMVSGNVMLTFTDLVLPGNAGMDVRFQRTYNLNGRPKWNFGLAGIPLRVRHPDGPSHCDDQPEMPTFITADGGERKAFPRTPYPAVYPQNCWTLDTIFLTSDFWRWDRSSHVLQLPNGWTIQYSSTHTLSGNSMAYAEEVRDPFNNTITIEWQGPHPRALWRVNQWFGGTSRTIEFSSGDSVYGFPDTMTFDGRQWAYTGGANDLTSVVPPVGPGWSFDYSDGLKVTAPGGGETHYRFKSHQFHRLQPPAPQDEDPDPKIKEVNTTVLDTRAVHDGINSGTWTYQYGHDTDGERITVIYPDGRQMIHVSGGTRQLSWEGTDSGGYAVIRRILKDSGGTELEREETVYEDLPVGDDGYPSIGDQSAPDLRRILRGGQWFQTDYQYRSGDFGDYHRPTQVVESGDAGTRTTDVVYDYSFSGWIKDRTASQTVSSPGGGPFSTSADFDDATGFKQAETVHGITTTFAPSGDGNVQSATDGHGHTTSFTYEWGVVRNTTTPEYQITRTINHDGTVASETRRGFTTTYAYDALGRLRWVTPPLGHAFETAYDDQGARWIEQRRRAGGDGSWTRFDLDGFGRLTGTTNSVGVRTLRSYDIYGRKTYETQPFTTSEQGRSFAYDALDRMTAITHSAHGTLATYAYPGALDVSITEFTSASESRTIGQDWVAFGDPSDARLTAVTDGEGQTFTYGYDTIGNLRSVGQPGGTTRTWEYLPGTALVSWEEHPESGRTSYSYHAGRLESKADAEGRTFGYSYDANDRLTEIGAGDDHTVTLDYDDSDNRILLENGWIRSEFEYDAANNLKKRRDKLSAGLPAPIDFETKYWYDLWDNLTHIEYPSLRTVQYGHDDEGRIVQVKVDGAVVADVEAHHPSGAVARLRYGNGIVEHFDFDDQDRLESWTGGPVALGFGYDRQGNVKSITSPNTALNQTFAYDRVDRLVQVGGFAATTYTYDALGNRRYKSAGDVTYHYQGGTNRLESVTTGSGLPVGQGSYHHDNAGNLKTDPSAGYDYTPFNMLERATVTVSGGGTSSAVYRYDGDGLRVQRFTPEGAWYYVHGPGDQVLSEYALGAAGPDLVREYVYLGSRLLTSIERGSLPDPPLTVRLTAPVSGEDFPNDETLTLRATASVTTPGDSIVSVEFFRDGISLGVDTSAPYEVSWTPNLPAGHYTLLARALTATGRSATSLPARIELFLLGRLTGIIVSPESPAAGELATVTLTGNDNPCGGAIVWYGDGEFEAYLEPNGLPLSAGTTTGTHRWMEGGIKTLVAEAQGHRCRGRVTHDITVKGPSATLTAPSAGATFYTPASIALAATASDTSGQPITRVDFYANGALLGSDATAPYGFTWSGAPIGTHVLVAKAVNALGIVGGSVPVTIEVEPPPFIITVNPASPSATLAAQVTVGAMPGCATVNVDFGDGTTDTFLGQAGQPLTGSHAWPAAGSFTISAIGQGGECPNRGTLVTSVQPAPAFTVSVSPASPLAGSAAHVTVTGPGPCTTVNVDFGDGTTQTLQAPSGPPITTSHTWTAGGTRTVTATGLGGACNYTHSTAVVVQPPLSVTVTPSSPTSGVSAQVTIGGPSTCTAVLVDFGDGTTQTLTNGSGLPVSAGHVWATTGARTVTATGTGGTCPAPASTTITVQPPPPPPLTVSVNPASPTAGVPANVTVHGPSACTTVNVSFGDGTTQTFMGGSGPPITNPHTWTTAGPKTLTAQGLGSACDLYYSTTITVLGPPSVALTSPSAGATYVSPASISLAASATATQGTITQVAFYANGAWLATDTTAPYAHSWTGVSDGTYSLTATATDSSGTVGTSSPVSVTVGPPQPSTVMGVTITPNPAGVGQTATITVTGTNPCTMLWMDFGDGNWWIAPINSLPFTTTHTWAAAGTYTVLARGYVTCGGEVTRPVTVGSAPEPEALVSLVPSVDAWAFEGDETRLDVREAGPWVPEEPMFAPQATVALTVDLTGTGSGTVTSSPGGLVCAGSDGQTCSASFTTGTSVTLAATPDAGSTFAGWGGACSGAGACTVPLASARLVVATFTVPPPWVTQYHHTDALGSVRAVTDTTGAVVRTHDYHPFGEGVGVAADTDPVRFTGKPRDGETGLDYFGARYYAQGAGRFTTVDPVLDIDAALADPQRWNRYSHALNSPLTYVDPDGRNPRLVQWVLRLSAVQRVLRSPVIKSGMKSLERASDRLLDISIRLTSSTPQPVVLGETGDRVSRAAAFLRSMTFNPRETITSQNVDRIKRANVGWLRDQIQRGARIYDIGMDPARTGARGQFYAAEVDLLRSMGYAQRVVAQIEVNGEKVNLMQWVRVF